MKVLCQVEGCSSQHQARGYCIKHYSRWRRHGDPLVLKRRDRMDPDAPEYECLRCQQVHPRANFHRDRSRTNGLQAYCKDCDKAYREARWEEHGPAINARRNAQRYGLTQAEYESLVAGDCEICGQRKDRMCVDHCHSTGRVRGLLCDTCNRGIGMLGDSAVYMDQAAAYLRKHEC